MPYHAQPKYPKTAEWIKRNVQGKHRTRLTQALRIVRDHVRTRQRTNQKAGRRVFRQVDGKFVLRDKRSGKLPDQRRRNGNLTLAAGSPVVPIRTSEGTRVGNVKQHRTARSYRDAIRQQLATGTELHGEEAHEYEFMRDGRRHVRISNRQYLMNVTAQNDMNTGERFPFGMIPITPGALGGRLSHFAELYQECKVLRLTVEYRPNTSATTSGAIAIYHQVDAGTATYTTGIEEMIHASSHTCYLQTSVWNPANLEVNPEDAIKRYFDEESGDMRFTAQGQLVVISASRIPNGTDCGNLFLHIEMEFFAPYLDYTVSLAAQGRLTLTSAAFTVNNGQPVTFTSVPWASAPALTFTFASSSVASLDLNEYILICTVTDVTLTTATWRASDGTDSHLFVPGQGFFVRFGMFHHGVTDDLIGCMFTDLNEAAQAPLGSADATAEIPEIPESAITWESQAIAPAGTVVMDCRLWKTSPA